MPHIVADSNIPHADDACAHLGDVTVLASNEFSTDTLRDCDILLCRSTRRIDADLLDGTAVRFVATATIGTDHIDADYLAARGIPWASAPGSNANSVSEYVTTALLVLAGEMRRPLSEMSIGVVGVGNVGSRVVRKCEALGMTVVQNDPPLARETGEARLRPLDDLMACDIVTFHVPLTREGRDPTWHLCDAGLLDRLKPGAVLINSSRGPVVDGAALRATIDAAKITAVALDVWENEPLFDPDLLARVAIGTPHIAGHALDAKVNGTKMVYDAACAFLGAEPQWDPTRALPPPKVPEINLDAAGRDDEDVLREAVGRLYDILQDDAMMRKMPADDSRGAAFRNFRRNYWPRREWHNTTVRLSGGTDALRAKCEGLGFRCEEQDQQAR
jgi:erythronate-4-phosphate dehydrogenase